MPIERYLDDDCMNRMTTHFQFLLNMIRESEGELALELRGTYFNLYYKGNSLAKVGFLARGSYRVEISNAFWCDSRASADVRFSALARPDSGNNRTILVLSHGLLHPFFQRRHLDDFSRRIKRRNYSEETIYEQMIITDNRGREDLVIIDRQVTDSKYSGQMDLLALKQVEANHYHFLILEVKLGNNPELGAAVGSQLGRYIDHIMGRFAAYKECYEQVYKRKKQLGLLDAGSLPTIEIVEGVEGQVVVMGYSGLAQDAIDRLAQAHPDVTVRQFSFAL